MKALKYKKFLILPIILGLALASCQTQTSNPETSTSNQAECRTVEHEAGETEVCGQPEQIVVLGPYVLEPLLALGVQPIGFADHIAFHQGDYDNPQEQIPYLGKLINQPVANVGLTLKPSIEAIVKVQPDLIIGIQGNASQYETLSQIAPTILLDWSETETNLRAIAQAVNRTKKAEQLLTDTEQSITLAREAFAPVIAENPNILIMNSSQLREIFSLDSSTRCNSLLKQLGFKIVPIPGLEVSKPNSPPTPISIETLPELNDADSIVVFGYDFDEGKQLENFDRNQLSKIKQAWQENAITQSLDASKAGRVYFIPTYLCAGLPGVIGTELYLEELKQQLLPQQN
ncbi:MAG: iron-siderophore ABC transporter substrate-binding protein [Cyanobacteria bacterium P01_G01_bin.67]